MHRGVVVAAVLLSGCLGASPPAPPASVPIVLADVSASSCAYNDLIFPVPIEQAQALLPAGFEARPYLDGTGVLVINTFDCDEGFEWNAWDLFVLAMPPAMPEIVETFDSENRTSRAQDNLYFLDLYSLALHSDYPPLRTLFESQGMPVGGGSSSRITLPSPALGSSLVQLEHGATLLGQGVVNGVHESGLLFDGIVPHHRQWHVTENGTFLLERVMTTGGEPVIVAPGQGSCYVSEVTVFAPFLGLATCIMGQDAIGGMEWTGRAYFFLGVAPSVG